MNLVSKNIIHWAAAFFCCLFLFSCENNEKEVNDIFTKKSVGVEEAKDVKAVYTTGGNTKAILLSPLMYRVQDTAPYIEFPTKLTVDFYNDRDEKDSHLKANYAKYEENKSLVFLKDSVSVVNQLQGDSLFCEELYWDRNRVGKEFFTDKPVKIRTKTRILNGIGMEASQDFKTWHIKQPTGNVAVPNNQFPQ